MMGSKRSKMSPEQKAADNARKRRGRSNRTSDRIRKRMLTYERKADEWAEKRELIENSGPTPWMTSPALAYYKMDAAYIETGKMMTAIAFHAKQPKNRPKHVSLQKAEKYMCEQSILRQ